ncbi:MAG: hypothetical protein GC192_21510 [Bacteroidetes bacterium]|nr:hypothetical protein [Bacteroidota bacterium]
MSNMGNVGLGIKKQRPSVSNKIPALISMIFSYIGYRSDTVWVNLNADIKFDYILGENAAELSEVVVTANKLKDDGGRCAIY